ncbi:MAG: GNAT family N-acetyltransferase [Candidatus Zixiibacteriota bacterium]
MSIQYRRLDFHAEGPQGLFDLYAATYGSSQPLERRWQWQYISHPRSSEVVVLVAEADGKLVGTLSHFPSDVLIGGARYPGFFASDSMVHPEYRRRGIMDTLLKTCADTLPLMYAKGTTDSMYGVRLKFGFRPVLPNGYLLSIVAPSGWALSKLRLMRGDGHEDRLAESADSEFRFVDSVGPEFDEFFQRAAPRYPAIVVRDAAYMTWRYLRHPYKRYHVIYRTVDGKLSSVLVLRVAGRIGHIVDIVWDIGAGDEPDAAIRFARKCLRRAGFTNLYCWCTSTELRRRLARRWFYDLKETHRLTMFASPEILDRVAGGGRIHLVDGDGDFEFL